MDEKSHLLIEDVRKTWFNTMLLKAVKKACQLIKLTVTLLGHFIPPYFLQLHVTFWVRTIASFM